MYFEMIIPSTVLQWTIESKGRSRDTSQESRIQAIDGTGWPGVAAGARARGVVKVWTHSVGSALRVC